MCWSGRVALVTGMVKGLLLRVKEGDAGCHECVSPDPVGTAGARVLILQY